jgi:hypothetical protein
MTENGVRGVEPVDQPRIVDAGFRRQGRSRWHRARVAALIAAALVVAAVAATSAQTTPAPAPPPPAATATALPRGVYFPPATAGGRPGPDEHTVIVQEDAGPVGEIAAQLAAQYGLRPLYVRLSRPSFNAYISPEQLAAVRADPRVAFVTDEPQQFVPNEFIVFLRADAGDVAQTVARLERQYGLRASVVSAVADPYFVAEIAPDRLEAVAADPAVLALDENQILGLN